MHIKVSRGPHFFRHWGLHRYRGFLGICLGHARIWVDW